MAKVLHWLLVFSLLVVLPLKGYAREAKLRTVFQQEPNLKIAEMVLSIWPEYDDPRVLVIYEGRMIGVSFFPVAVRFVIPRGAEIHMAGAVNAQGGHLHSQYKVTPHQDWAEVRYELKTPNFYMEFYYNPFEGGPDKKIDYLVQSFYPIDKLEINVQQPLRASDFNITPPPLNIVTDAWGFKYSHYVLTNVVKNKGQRLLVTYRKTDPNPSITKGGQQVAGKSKYTTIFWLIVTLIVVVVVVGVAKKRRRKGKVPLQKIRAKDSKERAKFCTNCGTALQMSHIFCPNCGKKVGA